MVLAIKTIRDNAIEAFIRQSAKKGLMFSVFSIV